MIIFVLFMLFPNQIVLLIRWLHNKHNFSICHFRLTINQSAHIKSIILKMRKSIGGLKHLSNYLPRNAFNQLHKLYVRPHLDYRGFIYHIPAEICDVDHSNILPKLMDKLEFIQYSAAPAITRIWRGTSRHKLYLELGWDSLNSRRWSRRLTLFHKILNNLTPLYTKEPAPSPHQQTCFLRNRDEVR